MVDPEERTVTARRPNGMEEIMRDTATWHPSAAAEPLTFSAGEIFG